MKLLFWVLLSLINTVNIYLLNNVPILWMLPWIALIMTVLMAIYEIREIKRKREPRTEAEVDKFLRQYGYDPDEVASKFEGLAKGELNKQQAKIKLKRYHVINRGK